MREYFIRRSRNGVDWMAIVVLPLGELCVGYYPTPEMAEHVARSEASFGSSWGQEEPDLQVEMDL